EQAPGQGVAKAVLADEVVAGDQVQADRHGNQRLAAEVGALEELKVVHRVVDQRFQLRILERQPVGVDQRAAAGGHRQATEDLSRGIVAGKARNGVQGVVQRALRGRALRLVASQAGQAL